MTDPGLPFRTIDPFLRELLPAQMLKVALQRNLFARLPASRAQLQHALGLNPRGAELMVDMLLASGVLARSGEMLSATPAFAAALAFFDLMLLKLEFADLVLPDMTALAGPFVTDSGEFIARSSTFALFRYDKAMTRTPENLDATRAWVNITTGLTRYEAPGLLSLLDIPHGAHILEIGGNSGEMARALCAARPDIRVTVFDLPVVCDIGRAHLSGKPEAARIHFLDGDALRDPWPAANMVLFKSVLHDWPVQHAGALLQKARAALKPGGKVAIFERAPFDLSQPPPYHALSNLVFLNHLRSPAAYGPLLDAAGLVPDAPRTIRLDMDFFLLTAHP